MTAGMTRAPRLAAALLSLMMAACAQPEPKIADTVFVVLPDDEGKAGAITVNQGGTSVVLDQPYAAAQVTRQGALEPVVVNADEVQQIFGDALSAQPRLPQKFLLYFELGGDELVPSSQALLDDVFADIAARGSYTVEVVGHTDRSGNEDYNARLSRERVDTITELLIARGAEAAAISAVGRGELDPLVPTDDGVAEPRNRRVEVTVR